MTQCVGVGVGAVVFAWCASGHCYTSCRGPATHRGPIKVGAWRAARQRALVHCANGGEAVLHLTARAGSHYPKVVLLQQWVSSGCTHACCWCQYTAACGCTGCKTAGRFVCPPQDLIICIDFVCCAVLAADLPPGKVAAILHHVGSAAWHLQEAANCFQMI
jgi:hypothetical protein